MTDRGIIFSAPMVQALLAGRKSQTRRLASSPLARALPGDRLWVRERFALVDGATLFRADTPTDSIRWTTPLQMPRKLSRLTLTVTGLRFEQLQEISESDADAEGVKGGVAGYAAMWEEQHGASSWETNPKLVAVTFEVRHSNIDR